VFDPDGEFVRRWLPALSRLPTCYVHAPWTAPAEVLEAADVELGVNYPYPIIRQQVSLSQQKVPWPGGDKRPRRGYGVKHKTSDNNPDH